MREKEKQPASRQKDGKKRWPKIVAVVAALAAVCALGLLILAPVLQEWLGPRYVTYRGMELPRLRGVELNRYDQTCFALDSQGWVSYEKGEQRAVTGIDVSSYQGEIDWQQVAQAGVEFAIVRVGYRGYGTGVLMEDRLFRQNIQGALDAGLEVGAYFFSQAVTADEAREEAEFLLQSVADYPLTGPMVFDWEPVTGREEETVRTDGLEGETLTACALAFCQTVEEGGYSPMIYFNQELGYLNYDLSQLTDYRFWLAEYNTPPTFAYSFAMWQYTNEGTVPGIDHPVDLNLAFPEN